MDTVAENARRTTHATERKETKKKNPPRGFRIYAWYFQSIRVCVCVCVRVSKHACEAPSLRPHLHALHVALHAPDGVRSGDELAVVLVHEHLHVAVQGFDLARHLHALALQPIQPRLLHQLVNVCVRVEGGGVYGRGGGGRGTAGTAAAAGSVIGREKAADSSRLFVPLGAAHRVLRH